MRDAPLLEVKELTVHFHTVDGTLKVIQGVELRLRPREMVGIVGETGCGKSVSAKLILGILPMPPAQVVSGSILFAGRDLLRLSERERNTIKQEVAYIPQDPMTSLNPTFTIGTLLIDAIVWRRANGRLLKYFRKRHARSDVRDARDYAMALLKRVDIPAPDRIMQRYSMELSGGMRQRVLMAMALIGHPTLLVADEPTTALDVTIQKRTLRLLQDKIEEEHLAGIYITHDLGVARTICNRTYVMYAGTVVESGPTRDLLDRPLHPYTTGLVRSIPKLTREPYEGIPGQVLDYLNPPGGCRFHPRCSRRMEVCRHASVPGVTIDADRWVACHLFSEEMDHGSLYSGSRATA